MSDIKRHFVKYNDLHAPSPDCRAQCYEVVLASDYDALLSETRTLRAEVARSRAALTERINAAFARIFTAQERERERAPGAAPPHSPQR